MEAHHNGGEAKNILLMGARRCGKSSVHRVVFHKMSPHETLFIENTTSLDIKYIANNSFVQFKIWDFPGDYDFRDSVDYHGRTLTEEEIFKACSVLVFVIDAQDEPYTAALAQLHQTLVRASRINPDIYFEVFVHKVDGDLFLSEEHKVDCQREIQQQISLDLDDAGLNVPLSFHLTSIYDHSIFEAFSNVVQKLIPQMPTLENLLNMLVASCGVEKAFLFDIVSKIYVATDSSPVDMQSYELCSDMIDVVIDVSCIYGNESSENIGAEGKGDGGGGGGTMSGGDAGTGTNTSSGDCLSGSGSSSDGGRDGAAEAAGQGAAGAGRDAGEGATAASVAEATAGAAETAAAAGGAAASAATIGTGTGAGFDSGSSSTITLNNGTVLYMREVNRYLALVCLVRRDNFRKQGLIEYNIGRFRDAICEVFSPSDAAAAEGSEAIAAAFQAGAAQQRQLIAAANAAAEAAAAASGGP